MFPNWNESSGEPLKKVTALEQITCEEKLKQLGFFNWEKRKIQVDLSHLSRPIEKTEPHLSLSCRVKGQQPQLQVVTVKFYWDIRQK